MAGSGDQPDWMLRWPTAAERVEVWDGRLVFELRGFAKATWTDEDVAAAERCYTGQRVTLSDSRALLFVDPPTSEPHPGAAAATSGHTGTGEAVPAAGAATSHPRVLRVTADQVGAARGLMRLRGADRVDPLIRKVAEARPAPGRTSGS